MKEAAIILYITGGIFIILGLWSCLKVAKQADEQLEKYWREKK